MFANVVGIILVTAVIVAAIIRFLKNETSPIVTESATLLKKVDDTTVDNDGIMTESLILIFDINGTKLKCGVSSRIYRAVKENTSGQLTHQGTRFISYEFNGTRVVK